MSYVCENMLQQYYITENYIITGEQVIEVCYYNIANKNKDYEWDIIAIYKQFDGLIQKVEFSENYCICPSCYYMKDKHQYIKNIKCYIYIMELMKTLTDTLIENQVIDFLQTTAGSPLADRINEYYAFLDNIDIPPNKNRWKNKNWYYQKLFGMPWILKKAGVPFEHYNFRRYFYFEDRIAGNPLSLCGWVKESMKDLEIMGAI